MANMKFCFPNHTQNSDLITVTATGADWIDLQFLQSDALSEMARYNGVDPTDTIILLDLGDIRKIDIFGVPINNAQDGDTCRVLAYSDAALTQLEYDSGATDFIGEIYPYGSLRCERIEWLDGHMTPEQLSGIIIPWINIPANSVFARYIKFKFDFTNNTDGFVDVGRLLAAEFVSTENFVPYGASPPFYIDPSTTTRSRGGVKLKDQRVKYRMSSIQFDWLDVDQVYEEFFKLAKENGVTEPFFFVYDLDAARNVQIKQMFYATADSYNKPTNKTYAEYALGLEISEAL